MPTRHQTQSDETALVLDEVLWDRSGVLDIPVLSAKRREYRLRPRYRTPLLEMTEAREQRLLECEASPVRPGLMKASAIPDFSNNVLGSLAEVGSFWPPYGNAKF